MKRLLLPFAACALALAVPLACGGSKQPASTGGGGGGGGASTGEPKVIVEDSTETWYEEPAGTGDKGSSIREYVLDVTKRVEWKGGGGTLLDAGPPPADRVFRVAVRFPVPKVIPDGARDPHAINRLLWDVRKEIAKCYYKGPGKEPGAELSLVGFVQVNKKGEITGSGIEKSDDALKKTGADECIMENVKGLVFSPSGDDTKIRFKLKLQTSEATGQSDVKAQPPSDKK